MPFERVEGFDEEYALISFDKRGRERTDDPDGIDGLVSKAVLERVAREKPSHVFLFSHGWKGDLQAARDQYNRWIGAMLALGDDRAAVKGTFKPMWIGLHWPSLPFGDEELAEDSFDVGEDAMSPAALKATYLDRLGLGPESEPLLDTIVRDNQKHAAASELPKSTHDAYERLAALAGRRAEGPAGAPDTEGEPFDPNVAFHSGNAAQGAQFGGGDLLGGILGPLRQLSYWTMKKRARTIGEGGMHTFVGDLMKAAPPARVHLMGHSFGCIVVSSILGGPNAARQLPRQVDSVALVQGAVSLWAFGNKVQDRDLKGYFNPWVHRPAVRGPVIVTRSIHDRAVGLLYPWASAVSWSDGSFDPTDEDNLPLYGAIGAFGIRGLPDAFFVDLRDKTHAYGFKEGKVYNLQASRFIAKGDGVSGAHSDIDGPEVAHALWQAALV
jgi:hypothetical protein